MKIRLQTFQHATILIVREIIFTKHAEGKFRKLSKHKLKIVKKQVLLVIFKPENIDDDSDFPKTILSGTIDAKHVLRVVCFEADDIIRVITFYPAEKGRYY